MQQLCMRAAASQHWVAQSGRQGNIYLLYLLACAFQYRLHSLQKDSTVGPFPCINRSMAYAVQGNCAACMPLCPGNGAVLAWCCTTVLLCQGWTCLVCFTAVPFAAVPWPVEQLAATAGCNPGCNPSRLFRKECCKMQTKCNSHSNPIIITTLQEVHDINAIT
jgi:hypothetical protein